MADKSFQKDEVIFRQGDAADSFYQITGGSVGIFVNYNGKEDIRVNELRKGEIFGEMGVIDAAPRSGSAIALEDGTTVREVSAKEAVAFLQDNPENVYALIKTLSKRLRSLTEEYDKAKETAEMLNIEGPGTDEKLYSSLEKYTSVYKNGRPVESAEVAREEENHSKGFSKNVVSYPKGTVICKEGDTVKCMYDVHWGRLGVFSHYGEPNQVQLTTLGTNDFFGEMGMIDDAPRSATVVALDDGTTVEIIYPEDLAELFEKNPMKIDMILRHISKRLRTLTMQYYDICEKISERAGRA
ncbi:MAG: cyclic nucleotide-binding domain-containing protein [Lachnospiraceae bacterium]|nr:cyclic nucleotide-binding domain-containing protein [Lachnospiraceae bacterium]